MKESHDRERERENDDEHRKEMEKSSPPTHHPIYDSLCSSLLDLNSRYSLILMHMKSCILYETS